MSYSNASIRRAIASCGPRRPATIQAWSLFAVDLALDLHNHCDAEDMRRLYRVIDSVAYGIRWTETSGRANFSVFNHKPWAETKSIIESLVRVCLKSGNTSADFVKEAYKTMAELKERHMAEA